LLRIRSVGWGLTVLRVVVEPLLDRFVSFHEPKPSRFIRINRPLHVELAERHNVGHRLRSAFFGRDEVKLIVDAPVVRHRVRGAVLEHQLRMALRDGTGEHGRWRWRDEIPHRIWDKIWDRIWKWTEGAVLKEYRRTRCQLHHNHSSAWSCQRLLPGPRLREGRSTRNEQSEKRETNRAAHDSVLSLPSDA